MKPREPELNQLGEPVPLPHPSSPLAPAKASLGGAAEAQADARSPSACFVGSDLPTCIGFEPVNHEPSV
jgi:hypothetical protein